MIGQTHFTTGQFQEYILDDFKAMRARSAFSEKVFQKSITTTVTYIVLHSWLPDVKKENHCTYYTRALLYWAKGNGPYQDHIHKSGKQQC